MQCYPQKLHHCYLLASGLACCQLWVIHLCVLILKAKHLQLGLAKQVSVARHTDVTLLIRGVTGVQGVPGCEILQ